MKKSKFRLKMEIGVPHQEVIWRPAKPRPQPRQISDREWQKLCLEQVQNRWLKVL
jgi:hypothetical protein